MHQQIRSDPSLSPPDVARFLEELEAADVNIVAVGGGAIEKGGEIAIACHELEGDDDLEKARRRLEKAGYRVDILQEGMNPRGYLHVGRMRNRKGELLREVNAARANAGDGYVVQDIAVGVASRDAGGETVYPVQIFCVRGG